MGKLLDKGNTVMILIFGGFWTITVVFAIALVNNFQ